MNGHLNHDDDDHKSSKDWLLWPPLSGGKMANDDDDDVRDIGKLWEWFFWFSTRSWGHDHNGDIFGDNHDGDGRWNLEEGRSDLSLLMDVRESGL